MYNVEDILTRLQNGESADAIAQSFTEALNGAIQKKQETEKSIHKQKVTALTDIIDTVIDFIEEFYPQMIPNGVELNFDTEDVEDIIKTLDNSISEFAQLNAALASLETLTKQPSRKNSVSNSDAIANFLKTNGLM